MFDRNSRRKMVAGLRWHGSLAQYARPLIALALVLTVISAGVLRTAQADDGDLDTTFDTDGKVTTDFPRQPEQGKAVAIQEDGKIVVAGYAEGLPPTVIAGGNRDFAATRYNTDGSLDDGTANDSTPGDEFGTDGLVLIDFFGGSPEEANAVAIQDDGKIVLGGLISGKGSAFALARVNVDGSLDDGTGSDSTPGDQFGQGGIVITESFPEGRDGVIHDLAIQEDDKIVAAGSVEFFFSDRPPDDRVAGGELDRDFALARYDTDGDLDQTFSTDGLEQTNFFKGNDDQAFGVALQEDGKIVAAGSTVFPAPPPPGATSGITGSDFALARYNTNGSLDDGSGEDTTPGDSFGDEGGRVITDFDGFDDEAQDVKIQTDGKIVAGGWADVSGGGAAVAGLNRDFAAARYNTDGTLDAGLPPLAGGDEHFSDDGLVTIDINGETNQAYGLAIQVDGKIVLAGYVNVPVGVAPQATEGVSNRDFALARLNTDGSLDDGTANDATPGDDFGDAGIVTTDFFNDVDEARDIAIQEDGKIVAAGFAFNQPTLGGGDGFGFLFAAARYNAGASADLSVDITDNPDPVVGGKNIVYKVKITNNGPSTATNVVLRNRTPRSSNFVSASSNRGTCSEEDTIVTCNIGTLNDGQMALVTIVVQTFTVPNTINDAEARVTADQPDPDESNNSDFESTRVIDLRKLSFDPPIVTGGCADTTGTLLLTSAAPEMGLSVHLADNSSATSLQSTLVIPGGATSASFPVMTHNVNTERIVTVTANVGINNITGRIKLLPIRVTSLSFTPNPVHGGSSATGQVTLSCAPEQNVVVTLKSNKQAAKPVQSQITIPAGQTTGMFNITTLHVAQQTAVTFTAIANGGVKHGVLNVIP